MHATPGLGVVTVGRDLAVQSWNGWLAEVTGVPEADAVGRPLLSLVPPARADLVRAVLDDVLTTGRSRVLAPAFHRCLIACPVQEPSEHFAEMQQFVTVAPLDASGGIAGAMITIEDVTARLDRERTLTDAIESGAVPNADAVDAVTSADWRLRGAAVRTLRQRASAAEIAHLLGALTRGYTDLNVVGSALQVLAAANRDVTTPLIELLSDPKPDLRMHAAQALGHTGDRAAIPALARALDDPNPNVTFHAIEALGMLGAADAVERLAAIAQSADFFLAFPAIDALAKSDDPRVAVALTTLLGNPLLRPAVVPTLGECGDEDAVVPLVEIVNTDRDAVGDVPTALVRIRDRYEESFGAGAFIVELARDALTTDGIAHLADALRARRVPIAPLITVLGWTREAGLEAIVGMLGDSDAGAAAAEAIAAMGRAALEPLVATLEGGDRDARIAAASLLGRLGDRRASRPLVAVLDSPDAELVAAAAAALAPLADPVALDALLPLFAHPQTIVRQAALAAINAIGATATAARIAPLLSSDDARVRACAVRVSGYFGYERLVSAIFAALEDADAEVRRAAIEQLPVLDDARAVPRLVAALVSETPRNRAAAAHALRSVDAAGEASAALVAALDDGDAWVRYFAAGAIARRNDAGAAPALARLAERDPAPHVRIAALQALAAVAPALGFTVAPILTAGDDADVAAAALAALAADPAPAADALFEQALRSPALPLRCAAVQALAARSGTRVVEMVARAARNNEPADLPRTAVAALGDLAKSRHPPTRRAAMDALVALAGTPATRAAAIATLAATADDAVEYLSESLASPREATRIVVAEALARMRDRRASDALVSALVDSSAAVRSAAVAGLGRLGTPVAARAIAEASESDPDAGVRRLAAAVCRRHGWPAWPEAGRA